MFLYTYINWKLWNGIFIVKFSSFYLKSLGPTDRKFHKHGENDGCVLCEYMNKQCKLFRKKTNINYVKKKKNQRKKHVNSKQNVPWVTPSFVSLCPGPVPNIHRRIERSSIIRHLNYFLSPLLMFDGINFKTVW